MSDLPADRARGFGLARYVHHVSFTVSNLAAALHFYEEILQLERVDPPRPDLGFPGVWLKAGACEVHLIVPPPGSGDLGRSPAKASGVANHVAFYVEDYDAALLHCRSHGLTVLEGKYGLRQMWVQDPDGNVIELIPSQR